MKDTSTSIAFNEHHSGNAYRMRFAVDWTDFTPGQFVMVSIPGNAVFLRRPFGIARLKDGVAEICYKVVGRGTLALSQACAGSRIDVLGPCGHGFEMPAAGETAVPVAGGYGIGPLFGLCEKLKKEGRPYRLFYGAKTEADFLYLNELSSIGADLILSTEDGSRGAKGFITHLLEKEIKKIDRPHLMACGPHGLLGAVAEISSKRKIAAQVSAEAYMACGIGVCLGCVCKDAAGNFVRTCREGPVFKVEQLAWK